MTYQPASTCRQYRLLITGSRMASPEMLTTAHQAVERAMSNGWMVLVGDNPHGVDAAVIDACDELGVNVLVFGISQRPRKGSQRDGTYWQVDLKRPDDDEEQATFAGYAARDRYMVDLADRVFALWNGTSKGTKAGYEYAVQSGKSADLRTFQLPNTRKSTPIDPSPPPRTSKPVAPAPHTVELIVQVHDIAGEMAFNAVYGLKALDGQGNVLYDTCYSIRAETQLPDAARMQAIIAGLERLRSKLKGDHAPYRLRIRQCSKNVDGWLAHGWKRNTSEVQRLTTRIEVILKAFPDVEWVKMPRPQVEASLSKLQNGGDAHK
jgi:hypothetical protein